jgi:hypothetical protein
VTGVDWGWVAAVTVIVAPFAYCALTTIRRGGRALTRTVRNRSKGPTP